MAFDALTIAAVADELQEKVVGGRIQGVFLPAPLAVGMEIYAHHETQFVFASAHPQHARIHLTENKLSRGDESITPLLLLMRKYVRDGRLVEVRQPPLERTLSLIITKADVFDKGRASEDKQVSEGPEITTVTLIVEMMGRYSNIILVDGAGVVLEAVKHVPAEINRYRVTLPRHPYVLPPPQSKADPLGLSGAALSRVLETGGGQPAWQALVRTYLGVSPLLAREAVFRAAAGAADAACSASDPGALASSLSALLTMQYTHEWQPSTARDGDTILEFAPYQLRQFGGQSLPAESISAAIHAYYAQETVASDYSGLKQSIGKALDAQYERVLRRKESMERQRVVGTQAEDLRMKGEMLLAYASQVAPNQSETLIELTPGEPSLRVALDPQLSAIENAQDYFRRYAQARDAARSIPPLLEQVRLDLAYLDQIRLDLDMAKTVADVREAQRALADSGRQADEAGQQKKPAPRGESKLPPLSYQSADGMEILVGRNARQNDYVTFELAAALDLWLHARGVAGSHVIVRTRGQPASDATIAQAAALAAAHSAARNSASVAVDYTLRRYVHRAKGGGPGLATYVNEKTVHIRPASA